MDLNELTTIKNIIYGNGQIIRWGNRPYFLSLKSLWVKKTFKLLITNFVNIFYFSIYSHLELCYILINMFIFTLKN